MNTIAQYSDFMRARIIANADLTFEKRLDNAFIACRRFKDNEGNSLELSPYHALSLPMELTQRFITEICQAYLLGECNE